MSTGLSSSPPRWRSSPAPVRHRRRDRASVRPAGRARGLLDLDEPAARRTADQIGEAGGRRARRVRMWRTADRSPASSIGSSPNSSGSISWSQLPHRSRRTIERTTEPISIGCSPSTSGVYLCSRATCRRMIAQGGGVILNWPSIASSSASRSGSLLDDERRRAYHDDVDRGGLREAQSGVTASARRASHAVRGRLRRRHLRAGRRDAGAARELQPIGRMGTPEEVAISRSISLDESSFVTAGLPDRRRRAGLMSAFATASRPRAPDCSSRTARHRRVGVRPGLRRGFSAAATARAARLGGARGAAGPRLPSARASASDPPSEQDRDRTQLPRPCRRERDGAAKRAVIFFKATRRSRPTMRRHPAHATKVDWEFELAV